jgi:GT2 family glycosyltransferase
MRIEPRNEESICNSAVVLVNFNGLTDTLECIQSLLKCPKTFRIIVVDNASKNDEHRQIADAFPNIEVIASRENRGWSGGNNLGIARAFAPDATECFQGATGIPPADIVLLLNNDTVVHPEVMMEIRQAISQGFDLVGPVINEYIDRDIVQTEGTAFNLKNSDGFFSTISVPKCDRAPSKVLDVDIVNGCAVAFTRKVYETIGPIDDRFFLICEESDFCLRAKDAGFHCGVIGRSLVFHKHSATFRRSGNALQRYYGARNLWLLLKKHKYGVGRKTRSQSILAYLRHMYHLFCFELEQDKPLAAKAVVNGVADAWIGRFGKMRERNTVIRRLAFDAARSVWKLRGGR